jgi:hypothetical protein
MQAEYRTSILTARGNYLRGRGCITICVKAAAADTLNVLLG